MNRALAIVLAASCAGAMSCALVVSTDNLTGGTGSQNPTNDSGSSSSGDATPGLDSGTLATQDGAAPVAHLAVVGGYDQSGNATSAVYTTAIFADGSLGAWKTEGSLPSARAQTATAGGFIAGGENASGLEQVSSFAGTFGSGDISGWSTGPSLLVETWRTQAVVVNGVFFVLGGASGGTTSIANVESAPITGGTLGAFAQNTALPEPLQHSGATSIGNYIIIAGGQTLTSPSVSDVFVAQVQGGTIAAWSVGTSLPVADAALALASAGSTLVSINGYEGGGVATSQFSSGVLSTWTKSVNLPVPAVEVAAVGYGNYVYVVGGVSDTTAQTPTANVYYTLIGADGRIHAWSQGPSLPSATYFTRIFSY